jgi:hypothetical protein
VNDPVNKPSHYTDGKIEVLDFIEDKKLGFHLGNVVKYVCRAGKKDPAKTVEDLKKARFYLDRKIKELETAEVKVKPPPALFPWPKYFTILVCILLLTACNLPKAKDVKPAPPVKDTVVFVTYDTSYRAVEYPELIQEVSILYQGKLQYKIETEIWITKIVGNARLELAYYETVFVKPKYLKAVREAERKKAEVAKGEIQVFLTAKYNTK